ncbi:MAG: TldE/PmbA family protein [Candidatus Eisenbacteria bacterium]|nr:TldE/PmbA family protein [Candidatus Latescibacterota bacterium]MBD3303443.1 TldE/PmbA family protein [Candidatus Eisenbacteria bacterium]
MQKDFYRLADHLTGLLEEPEAFTATYSGEVSDFVRLNGSRIRQPGRVTQRAFTLDLTRGRRHSAGTTALSGDFEIDRARVEGVLADLRERLPHLPEDPHHLVATEVQSSERHQEDRLPKAQEAIDSILSAAEGKDLVGIYAAGGIHRGFASSTGQRNWYTTYSFHFDWSLYHSGDKAVKSAYAGFEWDETRFREKMEQATEQLGVLTKEARTIPPGQYRVYLSPVAIQELLEMMSWGGFGLKDARTKQSPLLKLIEGETRLSEQVSLRENTESGVAPNFQAEGFIKPAAVDLVENGRHASFLVSPRSAKEYGVETNGANSMEFPESIELAPGKVKREEILRTLGTGIYVSNLWYLNYSDRPGGRITGMTRFATFWVENGEIVAPLNVMRFDETLFRIFGEGLVGLTAEPELLLDSYTYGERSTGSVRTPGAIVDGFTFTL